MKQILRVALLPFLALACTVGDVYVTTSAGDAGEPPDESSTGCAAGTSSGVEPEPSSESGSSVGAVDCFPVERDDGVACRCDGVVADPAACGCELALLQGGGEELFQCQCAGQQADAALCGCVLDEDEQCLCQGEYLDPIACHQCDWDPYDPDDCFCGDIFAPPIFCG